MYSGNDLTGAEWSSITDGRPVQVLAWSWCRHNIETFSALLALCEGNSPTVCWRACCDAWVRILATPEETTCPHTWWRHQMETFSALLAICAGNSPVPGEFPTQRPVTWSFDVFFDLRLNKRLSKQSWGWWFETLSRSLWRHCNVRFEIASLCPCTTWIKQQMWMHVAWLYQNYTSTLI